MRPLLFAALAVVVLGSLVSRSATTAAALRHACDFHAYGRDNDPRGTNVRAAPSPHAKIVGRLPAVRAETKDRIIYPEFHVSAGSDGWLLIDSVGRPTYLEGQRDLSVPGLRGWIAANLVQFTIGGTDLKQAPRADAPVLQALNGTLPDTSWGPDSVAVERVYGCSGSYVEATIKTPGDWRGRGWVYGVCDNQVSTCGGGGRPLEERDGALFDPAGP